MEVEREVEVVNVLYVVVDEIITTPTTQTVQTGVATQTATRTK